MSVEPPVESRDPNKLVPAPVPEPLLRRPKYSCTRPIHLLRSCGIQLTMDRDQRRTTLRKFKPQFPSRNNLRKIELERDLQDLVKRRRLIQEMEMRRGSKTLDSLFRLVEEAKKNTHLIKEPKKKTELDRDADNLAGPRILLKELELRQKSKILDSLFRQIEEKRNRNFHCCKM